MERQLALIEETPEAPEPSAWTLDDRTKEVGRRGLAEARRIIPEAARRAAAERHQAA
ncbi:MAG TPA: hypothetical protein VMY34_06155 [Acidimicrobiales bacterium]|nr:hypothetical protein [Acidimicrobiales bacterium]